jgi:glycerate-2-kinase
MIIQNRDQLLSHGNIEGRRIALDIIDATMHRVDACGLTRSIVRRKGNELEVGHLSYDLSRIENVYVLGAGKAVLQIAEALEHVLGDHISCGLIIEKRLDDMPEGLKRIRRLERIRVLQGSHPIPDEVAVQGAEEILEISRKAGKNDLLFFCVQGGCSALTTLPVEGISLEDFKVTTELLLKSGADIEVFDIVRTAATRLNEGCLAPYIHPAEIINLVVNDYVWSAPLEVDAPDPYENGWGPAVPAQDIALRKFEAVVSRLKQHDVWGDLPQSVKSHLSDPNAAPNVRDLHDFEKLGIRHHTFVLAGPQDGAEAALKEAEELGLSAMILSSMTQGEAREVGVFLAGIAKGIIKNNRPLRPPCAMISAGETTVTISGEHGEGGRNQELVLGAALKLEGASNVVVAAVNTDGTDGPTRIAGGIIDGHTLRRAREKGLDIYDCLKRHDASPALTRLDDAILFNQPGNNICDLSLIVVTD